MVVVRPDDVDCVFEAPPPAAVDFGEHPVNGEMCMPLIGWIDNAIRDAAWRRVYDEVLACKALQEAVRQAVPAPTP